MQKLNLRDFLKRHATTSSNQDPKSSWSRWAELMAVQNIAWAKEPPHEFYVGPQFSVRVTQQPWRNRSILLHARKIFIRRTCRQQRGFWSWLGFSINLIFPVWPKQVLEVRPDQGTVSRNQWPLIGEPTKYWDPQDQDIHNERDNSLRAWLRRGCVKVDLATVDPIVPLYGPLSRKPDTSNETPLKPTYKTKGGGSNPLKTGRAHTGGHGRSLGT